MKESPKEIFLSYGHIDNEDPTYLPTPDGPEVGWVLDLKERLEKRMRVKSGIRKNRIFMDIERDGTKTLNQMMDDHINSASILLVIASPSHTNSEYCQKEVEIFMSRLDKNGTLDEAQRAELREDLWSRIKIARKYPTQLQNPNLQQQIYTDFYDEVGKKEFFNYHKRNIYIDRINELALHLLNTLKAHEEKKANETSSDIPSQLSQATKKVFIAQPSPEATIATKKIESELRIKGYEVVQLDARERLTSQWKSETKSLLNQYSFDLILHIFDKSLNYINNTSIQEIQYDTIKEEENNIPIRQIVWIPQGTETGNQNQQQFFQKLRTQHSRTSAQNKTSELLESNFEGFKHHLINLLKEDEPQPDVVSEEDKIDIYYLFPFKIEDQANTLLQNVKSNFSNFQLHIVTKISAFRDKVHQKLLSSCDAYLIYPGSNEDFLQKSGEDIISNWKKNFPTAEPELTEMEYHNNSLALIYPEGNNEFNQLISYLQNPDQA